MGSCTNIRICNGHQPKSQTKRQKYNKKKQSPDLYYFVCWSFGLGVRWVLILIFRFAIETNAFWYLCNGHQPESQTKRPKDQHFHSPDLKCLVFWSFGLGFRLVSIANPNISTRTHGFPRPKYQNTKKSMSGLWTFLSFCLLVWDSGWCPLQIWILVSECIGFPCKSEY